MMNTTIQHYHPEGFAARCRIKQFSLEELETVFRSFYSIPPTDSVEILMTQQGCSVITTHPLT